MGRIFCGFGRVLFVRFLFSLCKISCCSLLLVGYDGIKFCRRHTNISGVGVVWCNVWKGIEFSFFIFCLLLFGVAFSIQFFF